MLCNLLLANITILLCYFCLFRVVFNNAFTILEVIEYAKLKFAAAIANDAIEMPPLAANNTIENEIGKRSNIFAKTFIHYFSFPNFSNKLDLYFMDFIYPKRLMAI